jgi:RHS repeat-associated protein
MNPDGQVSLAYDFDGNSRLVGITDDNQNRTSFGYDALNRRTTHTNADGSGFSYIYDRDHNIREATDPNGSVVTNSYDVLNRLVGRDIARAAGIVGTTRESYRYDGVSRLTAKSDDNGTPETTLSCELVYDSLSRLWEERQSVPTSPAPPEPQFIRGDCDGDGFVGGTTADIIFYANWAFLGGEVPACLAACDADGDGFAGGSTADIVYYANFAFLGRQPPPPPFPGCGTGGKALECASYPPCDNGQAAGGGGSQVTGVVSTVWSGDSKRLSCTYPGGRTLMNTFDGVDRYKTTSDAAGPIAECFWIGPRYRELRRVCGNGTSLSFLSDALDADVGYDGVKRVVRMRCFLPDGVTAFLDREYGYNRANMRTSETRHDDFGLTDRYSYDSLYRIARTELDQGGLAGGVPRDTSQIDYQLDGVGNRREVDFTSALNGPVSEVFEVNEMNEYTAIGGVDRSHDDNGNVLDDGERVYAYDYKNRLVSVSDKDNSDPIAQYLYHADNRRAWKTVFSAVPPGRIAKETVYFYDGWRVCEEQDGRAGATETTFVWSPTYVDGLVQLARTASHGLGEGTFYAHQNARADVVALTDGVGEVVERVVYDDFGNPSAVSAVGNPYFFQGRRLDEETGLYYFRNRYYDPGAGRFLQRDPVWDAGNVGGQYTFVGNGPVSAGDPLGLTPISFGPPPAGGPILPGGDQDDVVYPEYEPDPGDEPAPGLPEYSPPDDPPEFKLWLYLAQEIGTPVPWMDWDVDSYLNIYLTVTLTMVCDECENSPATPAADKPWGDLFSGDWYRRQVEEEWRPIVTDPRLRGFLKKQGFTEAEIDNPTFEQVEAMFSAFTSAAGLQQGESGSCEGSLDDPWDALEVWIGGKVVGAGIEAIGATGLFGRFLNLFRAKPPAPKPPTTNPRPGSFEDYPGFTTPNPPKPPRVLSPLRPGGPPPAPPIRPPFDLGSAFRHAFDHPAPGQAGRWRRDLLLDLFAN